MKLILFEGEEEMRQSSKVEIDVLEKEQKAAAMRQIAEARKAFVDQHVKSTEQHIANISRAVGRNRRSKHHEVQQTGLDEAFKDIENEWMLRREEMVKTREELSALQTQRIKRFVSLARPFRCSCRWNIFSNVYLL